jgi:hypothetical protein
MGPDYFKTIGTLLLRGRVIGEEDMPTSPQVAVVDETFARTFFPREDPIGKHFGYPQPGHSGDIEIIGVGKDTQYRDPTWTGKQKPMFFRAFFETTHFDEPTYQRSEVESEYMAPIELQVTGAAESVAPQVRHTLGSIDPNLSIVEMRSLCEQISRQFNEERLTAPLTELFSLLALLLASCSWRGSLQTSTTGSLLVSADETRLGNPGSPSFRFQIKVAPWNRKRPALVAGCWRHCGRDVEPCRATNPTFTKHPANVANPRLLESKRFVAHWT